MTEFLTTGEGRIAYDVSGAGPLVVLSHGMGDTRGAYRALGAELVAAGYRVATVDLRGSGESSAAWGSYSRTDTAGDLLAVVRELGGPAVLVGHSFSGGSVAIAAAQAPELVSAIVQLDPFTRAQKIAVGSLFTNRRYRRGALRLLGTALFGSLGMWSRYLDHAYPGTKPAGYAEHLAEILANLREPGRMAAMKKMGFSAPTDAGAQLPNIACPALVVMGTLDPDWASPHDEAAGIVALMPAGRGAVAMIEGAGHYPHSQYPDRVAQVLLPFLKEHAGSGYGGEEHAGA